MSAIREAASTMWRIDTHAQCEYPLHVDQLDEPSGDDDGDGYTNLEEWLHGYAAKVERRGK